MFWLSTNSLNVTDCDDLTMCFFDRDLAPNHAVQRGFSSTVNPLVLFPLETHTLDSLNITDQSLTSSDGRTEFVQSPSTGREHLRGHEARIELVRNDAHIPDSTNTRHSINSSSLMLAGMESSDIRRDVTNSSFSPFVPGNNSQSDQGNVSNVSNTGADINTAHHTSISSSMLRSHLSVSPTLSLNVPSSIPGDTNEHNYATNATSSLRLLASQVYNGDTSLSTSSTNTSHTTVPSTTTANAPSHLSLLSSRITPRHFSVNDQSANNNSGVTLCNNRCWPLLRNRNSSLRRAAPYTCRRHSDAYRRSNNGSGRAGY